MLFFRFTIVPKQLRFKLQKLSPILLLNSCYAYFETVKRRNVDRVKMYRLPFSKVNKKLSSPRDDTHVVHTTCKDYQYT